MALEQQLENIRGTLRCAYKQVVPGTVLCVDQLINERKTNLSISINDVLTCFKGHIIHPDDKERFRDLFRP